MVKGSSARFGAGTNIQTASRTQTVNRTTVSNFNILAYPEFNTPHLAP